MPEQISDRVFIGAECSKMQKYKMQWDFHVIQNYIVNYTYFIYSEIIFSLCLLS